MPEEDAPEQLAISADDGRRIAEAWAKKPGQLDVPDTLLNSSDIIAAVKATGLISPFYTGGGRKARLKKASYEGRIGSRAYIYRDKNVPERIYNPEKDDFLRVPRNSIVFVESDLDFRLPDFIALRFNLQIQHVHRGLLLGTGPLVDPGFWGKLCIPLHNLTDEDYDIPKGEGLIWVEFTKTTLPVTAKDDARVPLDAVAHTTKGNWDILQFLNKAANQYDGHKIPIRSSLPTMFEGATKAAEKSAADAKSALETAEKLRSLNTIAMVAAAIGLGALSLSAAGFLLNILWKGNDFNTEVKSEAGEAQSGLKQHLLDVDRYQSQPAEVRSTVPALRAQLDREDQEIKGLNNKIDALQKRLEQVERRKQWGG